jgi:hypothetical protein
MLGKAIIEKANAKINAIAIVLVYFLAFIFILHCSLKRFVLSIFQFS